MPALVVAVIAVAAPFAAAGKKTICTITVNSPDEREAMRARLPKGDYDFVELVEKGRADWLRSACERKVQCDALVISGHFNAGEDFYSDKIESREHLRMDELERASCTLRNVSCSMSSAAALSPSKPVRYARIRAASSLYSCWNAAASPRQ